MKKQNYSNKELSIHPNVVKRLSKPLTLELYQKLIDKKTELSNRPFTDKLFDLGEEKGGDQADQVNRLQEETRHTDRMQRDLLLLEKVVKALERMEKGHYGVCEYTGENIEKKRLLSVPWTTLSIEGAELEEHDRHFKAQLS